MYNILKKIHMKLYLKGIIMKHIIVLKEGEASFHDKTFCFSGVISFWFPMRMKRK